MEKVSLRKSAPEKWHTNLVELPHLSEVNLFFNFTIDFKVTSDHYKKYNKTHH